MSSEAAVKNRVRSTGGTKGTAIVEYMAAHPDASRKAVAEASGCCVARVGEVVRAQAHTPAKVTAARSARCEHEKAKKIKTGSCKVCPPLAAKQTGGASLGGRN